MYLERKMNTMCRFDIDANCAYMSISDEWNEQTSIITAFFSDTYSHTHTPYDQITVRKTYVCTIQSYRFIFKSIE
jgi:hypothetical protein